MSIIKPRRGSGSPTGLTANELAIDTTNKRVYLGNAAGTGDIVASHIENYVSSFNGSSGAVTFVNYVSSVNGATGAITNVAKTDVAQTFTATQNFTAGISASGGTFASAIRVDGFVDIGLGGGGNNTNLMVGYQSLDANTSGLNNTAIGYNTLGLNQDGTSNLAVGSNALSSNVSGIGNVGLGSASLQYSTSNFNTAVGGNALIALGFFGLGAGSQNVAVGYDAGKVDPSLNPIWGITGCVMIGYDTRPLANNGTNETVIGYNGRGNGSNTTTIGNTSTTDAYIHGLLHLPDGLSADGVIGFTYSSSAPSTPAVGDRWIDADTGKEYVYINDGDSSQWIQPVASNGLVGVTYDNGTSTYHVDASVEITGTVTSDDGYRIGSGAINSQSGSTYTLLTSDNGKVIVWNYASGATLTVPSGLAVGFNATVIQTGTGSIGITGSGTTLNSFEGKLNIAGQHAAVSIISYSSNVFNIAGGLTG